MTIWSNCILALGDDEDGPVVTELCRMIGESPIISETPESYNDPEGKTKFYKFINSGLEFGFRSGKLNHIHFFVRRHEGYSEYRSDVLGQVAQVWNAQDIVKRLGPANTEAPARVDMLIGDIKQWLRYEFETYVLRMEFSKKGGLWKVTLMVNPLMQN